MNEDKELRGFGDSEQQNRGLSEPQSPDRNRDPKVQEQRPPTVDPNVAMVAMFGIATLGFIALAVVHPGQMVEIVSLIATVLIVALLGLGARHVLKRIL